MSSRARLSRTARRWWLVAHILCGVGWMGADVVLAALVVTARLSDDGATVSSIYTVLRLVIPWTVPFMACGMLVTGVVLGWGTKYGLVQWWWVLVKLGVGVVLTVLVFASLVPGALGLPQGLDGTAEQVRAAVGDAGTDLMFPPFVSFAALAFALVLSVFKPWGRTRWGRRRESAPESAPANDVEKAPERIPSGAPARAGRSIRAGAAATSEPARR